jgi:hypothetical protein
LAFLTLIQLHSALAVQAVSSRPLHGDAVLVAASAEPIDTKDAIASIPANAYNARFILYSYKGKCGNFVTVVIEHIAQGADYYEIISRLATELLTPFHIVQAGGT